MLSLEQRRAGLKAIAEECGAGYSPVWLSPVCSVTPNKLRNHTGCNYALCTCRCHPVQADAPSETPASRPVAEAVSPCQPTLF